MSTEDELDELFTDKKGRAITIRTEEGITTVFTAYHEGKPVGEFRTYVDEDGIPYAQEISVASEYQRAGIGLRLVQRASAYHGTPLVPPGRFDTLRRHDNYMTGPGRSLMHAGQNRGWVAPFPDDEIGYD
jgi:hypothetical protein